MADNIDMTNGQANIAFLGARSSIWHRMGQEMKPGQSTAEWAKSAGLLWTAEKVPAIPALVGPQWDHIEPARRMLPVEGRNFIVRSDNGHALGYASDGYQIVQPLDVLEWFERYTGVDDRFHLDVAGSLKQGEIIWATATFREPMKIVGEDHVARLLMTTTFDGTGSTINKGTMTRVVCNNTLDAALSDARATIRTRHSTKFDHNKVANELAAIASGFGAYKAMAEAMVQVDMAAADVSAFFKACLDIPFDAKQSDISGRKFAAFGALSNAYRTTVAEGTTPNTAWTAINAVTRYVDHDKNTRGGDSKDEARVLSANFGSGAALKAKAYGLLLPAFKDRVLVAA
jgi:phage/plasmid-like protein (TIGR03299 family)